MLSPPLTNYLFAGLPCSGHPPEPGYEFFRLLRHCDWVDCTLPHRNALVSNTLSQRKVGF
jgi:hypothetical protein